MNKTRIRNIALREMSSVAVNTIPNSHRYNVIDGLEGSDNVGIELGVAGGRFSERMLNSGKFSLFFGVDIYGDVHDTSEYKRALKRIGLESPFTLLRMRFDEALDLFENNYFDFIYIDGFAHTGEQGGQTLIQWAKKLKPGGILAGDDYHDDWPLVKWAVNEMVVQSNSELKVTEKTEDEMYCRYPSWYMNIYDKQKLNEYSVPPLLLRLGNSEHARINRSRFLRYTTRRWVIRVATTLGLKATLKKIARRLID